MTPLLLQETHQYFTLERIKAQEGEAAAAKLQEAPSIQRPVFRPPWQPLRWAPPFLPFCTTCTPPLHGTVLAQHVSCWTLFMPVELTCRS
jgi:hypothetical protein